jgi:hypothetical protein
MYRLHEAINRQQKAERIDKLHVHTRHYYRAVFYAVKSGTSFILKRDLFNFIFALQCNNFL